MRTATVVGSVALTAVLSVGVAACGAGTGVKSVEIARVSTSPAPDPGPGSGGGAGDSDACAEVRRGIDAFNQGDFDATVAHFTQAVPLATAQAAAKDTPAAEDLLAAVTYYAQLAPADYPQAARTSPEFAKYKSITLGQCEGDQASAPSPSGVPA